MKKMDVSNSSRKIVIDPDFPITKFKYEDVVEIKRGSYSEFGLVTKVIYLGTFTHCEECGKNFSKITSVNYEYITQMNSRNENGTPLKAGKRFLISQKELEEFEKINYPYTITNILI